MDTIKLGDLVKDTITGFQGTCYGRVDYLLGDSEYLIIPKVKEDGTIIDGKWFIAQRVEKLANS